MNENWFYQVGDKARPASASELQGLRASHLVSDSTMVRQEGVVAGLPFEQTVLASRETTATAPLGPPPPAFPSPDGRIEPVFASAGSPTPPVPPSLVVADDGWQDTSPRPWRRYFARMFDLTLLSAAAGSVLGIVIAAASPELFERVFVNGPINNRFVDSMVSMILVIPILAVLIGLFGTSPGKWFMGVRVTGRNGRPIGLRAGLAREFNVYLRGLGLGIPVIALFTCIGAHNHLKEEGACTWDERKPWVVTHRPSGVRQVTLALTGVALWLVMQLVIRSLE